MSYLSLYKHLMVASILFITCFATGNHVFAQSNQGELYEQNALPDIDAYPMHVGSFSILPKLKVFSEFVDNIFASDGNEESDLIVSIEPEIEIKKSIRDHEFNLNLAADHYKYLENDSEDITNYGAYFFGHLTGHSRLRLPFSASYFVDHKQRNIDRTANRPNEPIRFKSFKTEVGVEYTPNRLFLYNYLRHEARRFDNGRSSAGAVLVREDGDYDSLEYEGRIGYETDTDWTPFVGLTVGRNNYLRRTSTATGFDGVNRDNDYVTALAGVNFNYKGLLIGEFGVWQSFVRYDDGAVDDINALAVKASASWLARERTIIDFELGRRVREDNLLNVGIVETEGLIGVGYEIKRDLFLNSYVRVQNDDFDVGDREDNIYTGSVGLHYIINPRFQLEADFIRRMRSSNVDGGDYNQNIFRVGVTGTF